MLFNSLGFITGHNTQGPSEQTSIGQIAILETVRKQFLIDLV